MLSSRVQLDISWVEHEKIKFISTNGHVIFCLLYWHQTEWKRWDLLCNQNDGNLFTCEDNMFFFIFMCEDMKFSCKSSLGILILFLQSIVKWSAKWTFLWMKLKTLHVICNRNGGNTSNISASKTKLKNLADSPMP